MKKYAFFDVDDTLVSIKTVFSFQNYWYKNNPHDSRYADFEKEMCYLKLINASWEWANKRYYSYFSGRSVNKVEHYADQWFEYVSNKNKNLFHKNTVNELYRHQSQGVEAVFVSGSFSELLRPIAKHLCVKHILAIKLEKIGGRYTGNILPPQTIGSGKAEAILGFLKKKNASAGLCYGYADDISDLQMLNAVGFPVVVSGGRGLTEYANKVGWKILQPF